MTREKQTILANFLVTDGYHDTFLQQQKTLIHAFLGVPKGTPRIFPDKENAMKGCLHNRTKNLETIHLPQQIPYFLQQIHSNTVHIVTPQWRNAYTPHALPAGDALVTKEVDVLLGIKTADCCPLLWYEKEKNIIAATHAGWKGTLKGVIEETHNTILTLGGHTNNLYVAIGPTIAMLSYVVNLSFKKDFCQQYADAESFFNHNDNKLIFDLPGFIQCLLKKIGIKSLSASRTDTFANANFFSRRASLANRGVYGNNESYIMRTKQTGV